MNKDNDFLFLSWTLKLSLRIQLQKKITTIVRIERGIGAAKFEVERIHLFKWRFRGRRRRFCLSSLIAGNSALLPSVVVDFAMILAGNSFIVRCHVTSKYNNHLRERAVGGFQQNNKNISICNLTHCESWSSTCSFICFKSLSAVCITTYFSIPFWYYKNVRNLSTTFFSPCMNKFNHKPQFKYQKTHINNSVVILCFIKGGCLQRYP